MSQDIAYASPRLHSISNPALACNHAGVEFSNCLVAFARGFRNRDNYRLRMLLIGGGLTSPTSSRKSPIHPPESQKPDEVVAVRWDDLLSEDALHPIQLSSLW